MIDIVDIRMPACKYNERESARCGHLVGEAGSIPVRNFSHQP